MSDWVRRVTGPDDVASAVTEAVAAARATPGIATVILPGNAAWTDVAAPLSAPAAVADRRVDDARIAEFARMLRDVGPRAGLILSGPAARGRALDAAGRIASATGAHLFGDMFISRAERGRGRPRLTRIPYPVDQAVTLLRDYDVLVLVGATPPVAFFAYPGKPSALTRPDARMLTLSHPGEDAEQALAALADLLPAQPWSKPAEAPFLGNDGHLTDPLTDDALSRTIARFLPDNAIVVDEALTSVRPFYAHSAGAAPHDYLMACTGGAIGAGLPVATGAAVACPDRKVICLQADGSGMYTAQALWTQARENLDVVTIVFANRAYAILQSEMRAVGVDRFGRNAEAMLSLDRPALDWVRLAEGMGVEGRRVATVEDFAEGLGTAIAATGPRLIEAII